MMPRPLPRFIPPLGPPRLSARQKVLAAWRGLDLAPQEMVRKNPAHPINEIMPAVLGKLGLDQRRSESEIVKVWNHLVDPLIAQHAQPVGLNKGTLFVNVDSSPWLDELVRYRRREILERLQNSFGKDLITRISFRLG